MADGIYFRTSIKGFNKTDVLQYIKGLLDEKSELTSELKALKNELQEQKRIIEEQAQNAADAVLNEIDIEKLSEQKLGKVMCDARRFSDLIVQEANEKADFIFGSAAASSGEMAEQVKALKNEAESLSTAFVSGLTEITEKLSALGNSLAAFSSDVEEERKNLAQEISA